MITFSYSALKLALNPIVVNVDAADPVNIVSRGNLRYYLTLMVPSFYGSNTFTALVEFEGSEKPPETVVGGTIYRGAFFELQEQLESLLFRTAPTFGQTGLFVADGLVTPYYAKVRVENNDAVLSDIALPVAFAIKAGVAERDFAAYKQNFFTDYMAGRFLTWAEDNRRVQADQPEFLYWLCNGSPLPSSMKLMCEAYSVEGSESRDVFTVATINDVRPMTVYGMAVGPAALSVASRAGTLASYCVWLEDELGNRLSEFRTYRMDADYHRSVKYVLFANSLGGFDTLCLVGDSEESVTVSRTVSDRFPDYNYLPSYGEKVVNSTTGERQLMVNTGWLVASARRYLQELLLTKEAYVVTDRAFLPLIPSMDSGVLTSTTEEGPAGRLLSFTYANAERNFSNLPKQTSSQTRATAWRPKGTACLIDQNGRRTGKKAVMLLEKYYLDDNSRVVEAPFKANVSGTEGYIAPDNSPDCQTTPFLSAAISRSTTFLRSTCENGNIGGPATIVIPAGSYGSEVSQADANAKAEAYFASLNTQVYANSNGSCTSAPELYSYNVPAGKWHYRAANPDRMDVFFRDYNNYQVMGNSQFLQGSGGANVFPFGSNDLDFPLKSGDGGYWFFRLYGKAGAGRRVRVYQNGTLVSDTTLALNSDGYEQLGLIAQGFTLAVGDKIYVRNEDV